MPQFGHMRKLGVRMRALKSEADMYGGYYIYYETLNPFVNIPYLVGNKAELFSVTIPPGYANMPGSTALWCLKFRCQDAAPQKDIVVYYDFKIDGVKQGDTVETAKSLTGTSTYSMYPAKILPQDCNTTLMGEGHVISIDGYYDGDEIDQCYVSWWIIDQTIAEPCSMMKAQTLWS